MRKIKPLKCTVCKGLVPSTHYAYARFYEEASDGSRPVFCTRRCSSLHLHSSYTPEQLEAKIKKQVATGLARGSYKAGAVKAKQTCIKLFGDDYVAKWHKKGAATYKARTGFTNPWRKGAPGRKAYLSTIQARYDVESNISQNNEIKAKVAATCDLKYQGKGLASPAISKKIKATNKKKYGVECSLQNKEVRAKVSKTWRENNVAAKALETKRKNGTAPKDVAWKGHETKRENGTYTKSLKEDYVYLKLKSLLGDQVIRQYRSHPDYPWAADFYDPVTDTIYEYQGFATHGGEPYCKAKHKAKVKELKSTEGWLPKLTLKIWTVDDVMKRKAGVRFVEWFNLDEFDAWVDAQVAYRLNATYKKKCFNVAGKYLIAHDSPLLPRIGDRRHIVYYPWDNLQKVISMFKPKDNYYARKLAVKVIPNSVADRFCDKYHLQRSCRGTTLAVGLLDDQKLLAVMTFGKPRYNKNYDCELLRLCYSANIAGGASKMFKFALQHIEGTIISYCDLAKFNGDVYKALGFTIKANPKPSTVWYNFSTGRRVTSNLLRQHGFDRLVGKQLGATYSKGSNNETLMKKHGFVSIIDKGQATFTFKR